MFPLSRFRAAEFGNTLIAFALMSPVLILLTGGAIDYASMLRARTALQAVADGAALTAAKELRLSRSTDATVVSVAESYARSALPDADDLAVSGGINKARESVTINLTSRIPLMLPDAIHALNGEITASAEAMAYGGAPICILGLNPSHGDTVRVSNALITAPSCAVRANSTSPSAVRVDSSGSIKAAVICSGGGVLNQRGVLDPAPKLDCPATEDPLATRPQPKAVKCDYQNKVVSGFANLQPGVYCRGLKISMAFVTLDPGTYIIKDGPLIIENGSQFHGTDVSIFFTGPGARFRIDPVTVISLAAPKAGPMAGLLFSEDRKNPPTIFEMYSLNAPMLLGTFYLPKSELKVGTIQGFDRSHGIPMGRQSSWTIVVAQKILVTDGLDLILNTDYGSSPVPVPGDLIDNVALLR